MFIYYDTLFAKMNIGTRASEYNSSYVSYSESRMFLIIR